MKVLVTGSNGMLGTDLVNSLKEAGHEVISATIEDCDITNRVNVEEYLNSIDFDVLIHTAAYTNVDGAEEQQATAFMVNAEGTRNLAEVTAQKNIPMVYISTDYVFDGTSTTPYEPNDKTCPINVYGESKLAGENYAKLNPKHYIARISWLYGLHGNNFVETMISLGQKHNELKVVNDQKGCPTWTMDVSKALINLIDGDYDYGIYHLTNGGETTWYGFACEIFKLAGMDTKVNPVTSDEFPRPAKRPAYSVMNNSGMLRDWKLAIKEYIELRKKV